jgi:prophage DNA circulation protein
MSWRDTLGPASFRGVPFFVESSERSGGRRTVKHEFLGQDKPFHEDLGRAARSFPIEGYVLGENYFAARDLLVNALEAPGPGELLHPYHGALRVICPRYRLRETRGDGGIATFSIEFEQTDALPSFPAAALDSAAAVRASGAAAKAASDAAFQEVYSLLDLPATAVNGLAGIVRSAGREMDRLLAPLVVGTQALASVKAQISNLVDNSLQLVTAPAALAAAFLGVLEQLATTADPRRHVAAILAAYDFNPGVRPPATTPRRVREQASWDATRDLFRGLVLSQATLVAVAGSSFFGSFEDAVAAREAITEKIDDLLEVSTDSAFPSLTQLRADLVNAMPGASADLPRLVSYTPIATVPSLVITYRLYGNLDGEADLLERNHVRHPGFIPGGRVLEVLSHA